MKNLLSIARRLTIIGFRSQVNKYKLYTAKRLTTASHGVYKKSLIMYLKEKQRSSQQNIAYDTPNIQTNQTTPRILNCGAI